MVWLPDIRVVILRKKNPHWGFGEAGIRPPDKYLLPERFTEG